VIRINDDPMGDGKDQFFPWMVAGSDGVLHASWMDRRDDPNGFMYREYYSQSTNGGVTWSPNQPVTDVGSTPGSFIGDYSGLAVNSDNSLVLPIWTDMRSGQRAYIDRGIIPQGTPTPTPTSPTPTPTAPTGTPTPTVVPMLVGHVTWQGHAFGSGQSLPVTLTLRSQGGGPDNEFTSLTTDASGFFTVPVGTLPAGGYNWRTKGPFGGANTSLNSTPGYLAVVATLTLSGAPATQVEMGTQPAGDVDGDNTVGLSDFNALRTSFGRLSTDPGYDGRTDYDGNSTIGLADFNLLKANFGLLGAGPIAPDR